MWLLQSEMSVSTQGTGQHCLEDWDQWATGKVGKLDFCARYLVASMVRKLNEILTPICSKQTNCVASLE